MLALEPGLGADWEKIVHLLRGARRQLTNREGTPPRRTREVAGGPEEAPDPGLEALFGDYYRRLRRGSSGEAAVREWLQAFLQPRQDGLAKLIRDGESVPERQLRRIWGVRYTARRLRS